MNRKQLIIFGIVTLMIYSLVQQTWPLLFPKTEVVILNASGQEVRDFVAEMPGESVVFGKIPVNDFAARKIKMRFPEPGFQLRQRGTLTDGTPIRSTNVGREGVPYARIVFVVTTNGFLGFNVTSGNRGMPNK